MPRGEKSAYTDKQKRQAEHIEEGYEERGLSEREAERRQRDRQAREVGEGKRDGHAREGGAEHQRHLDGDTASARASVFDPMRAMTSDGGPTKTMPARSSASANAARSERKP